MADQNEVARVLFQALPSPGEPDGWRNAPVLDSWSLMTSPNEREVAVTGIVSGSKKFPDGRTIRTSALRAANMTWRFIETQNSIYQLGWPECASLAPDADHVWPPALFVASRANWYEAVTAAIRLTEEHTISDAALAALTAALHDDGDWPERRAACHAIAEELSKSGRLAVAEAWRIMSADLAVAEERGAGAILVRAAVNEADRTFGREVTTDESLAEKGWRLLASMDDHQVEKLPREGLLVDDSIATAQKVALIAERVARSAAGSGLEEVSSGADGDPESDAIPPQTIGVLVLRDVGGTALSSTGKEVRKEFEKITGLRLPFAPVGDVAAVRLALQAEFPHAADQIDVLLADLAGAKFVRLRPSLIVGDPGGGKSRLIRRLSEVLKVGLHRFDGAGSSDNTFGGTPRRWSSGEHCVPLEAVRRHMIANPIVMIDEIDKAGTSRHNGALAEALMPFLEVETSGSYPDPYVQSDVDLSHVSYLLTANKDEDLPGPLKDRLRIIRLPRPGPEHMPALARGIVADFARERGGDPRWWPPLDDVEIAIAEELWAGGSIRRLRTIVERLLAMRERNPRH